MSQPTPLLPDSPLAQLDFLTPREVKALHAAQVFTVADVLRHAPRRYEDRRSSAPIASLANGDAASLMVQVYSAGWRFSYKRYFEASVGGVDDPRGARLLLRWFNMPYVAKLLAVGMRLSIYGKVKEYGGKWTMTNPDFETLEEEDAGRRLVAAAMGGEPLAGAEETFTAPVCVHTGRIVPIYRTPSGISARAYRTLVWELLGRLSPQAPWEAYDIAPSYPYLQSLRDLHFPQDDSTARKARLRFALAECFARQFRVAWRRSCTRMAPGQVTATTDAYLHELLGALPFSLTAAQQRCIAEIRADMARPTPMNRLLQGDVGSGKTLVALCAMLLCLESGKTAALIAPTQILAEQHYRNFCHLLRHTDVRLSLRTGGRADDSALELENAAATADATPRLIVGTHALLYPKNRPQNLGLAVIDEQHKFGVEQRERFISAGRNPDVLVMTATPIPRTLTLTFYGELDVSVIDELPANRGEITTALRSPRHMKRIISFMKSELDKGRQIYVVSPLIESSEASERSSATEELERWRAIFPSAGIGLLHGRMTADEKDAAMADFRSGNTHILVATTVIEVGVDVPNATIMLINNADSFGLSQLHQLRGRIGRGEHKGWCILLSTVSPGDPGRDKLEALCRTTNGFEIAEEDFRLRGPGDVLGTAQSGLGGVQFAEWLTDARLIHRANKIAASILSADPTLSRPEHQPLRAWTKDCPGATLNN